MLSIEVQLAAGIGERILIRAGKFADHVAMVLARHVGRPRFLLGGSLDGSPQVSLLVITEQGEEFWLGETEVAGFGELDLVTVFLPFTSGHDLLMYPSRRLGQIVGWEASNADGGTRVLYRVHLADAPRDEHIKVEAHDLEF